MSAAVTITLEEFLARPDRDDDQREELLEGELVVSPGAKVWHAEILDRLRQQLASLARQGFVLRNDFSCILGDRSMPIPDLAVVQQRRWSKASEDDGWLTGSPELVIEVASPRNRKLHVKAGIYLEHGAEQVWIVCRKTRTITVVKGDTNTVASMGETVAFHGVPVAVSSIFQALP